MKDTAIRSPIGTRIIVGLSVLAFIIGGLAMAGCLTNNPQFQELPRQRI